MLAIALICCGCAQTAQQEALDALRDDLQSLQDSVTLSTSTLAELQASEEAGQLSIDTQIVDLSANLESLRETVVSLRTSCPQPDRTPSMECKPVAEPIVMADTDKMLLGETERVWVDPPGISMAARIDTGASSSSLHADNITSFERDGDNWVRFDISNEETTVTIERPVTKFVRVFQQADKSGSRRPVIDLRLFLGNVKDTFSFTLADRGHLEHDMILGRNFLTDIATVDVSQQFVQPAYSPAEQ